MASLNKVMVIGNCGRDPEVRSTPSGQKVASVSLAVTEKFKDKNGQQQEKTEWVNIQAWRRQAEIMEQYVRKGSALYVEGKLSTSSWDDQNGQKRYKTEVVVSNFQMLGGPKGEAQPQKQNNQPSSQVGQDAPPSYDDNLPF